MTNEERLLHALYGIKKVLNDLGLEDIKNKLELKDGNSETIDCINVLQEFVVDYVNINQPYKFEDLKEGMWVWDDKDKKCNKIIGISENNEVAVYYITQSTSRYIVKFEENRFYPLTKAMEEFKNE